MEVNMDWLLTYQANRKAQTLERTRTAIESLKAEGKSVSVHAIVERIYVLHSVRMAPSTIFRNAEVRRLYESTRVNGGKRGTRIQLRLDKGFADKDRKWALALATRLLSETKATLINQIIRLKHEIERLENENEHLREQLLLDPHEKT